MIKLNATSEFGTCENAGDLQGLHWTPRKSNKTRGDAMLRTVLIIVLILFLLGALPVWPYSASWGYYPSGGLGLLLIVAIILVIAGR